MKLKFFICAMTAMALVACSQKGQASNAENSSSQDTAAAMKTAEVESPTGGEIIVLNDDSRIRPDMKPEKLTILDFNATWCPPCREFAPVFDEAAGKYPEVEFISIDVDKNKQTAAAFGIQSIPTVVFMNADGEVSRYVGTGMLLPAENFHKLIDAVK